MLDGIGVSNGLGWSPDARTMYFIDTVTEEIRSYPFDLETGFVGQPRTLAKVDRADGVPDGHCTDDEGYLWVALWGGGCVRRYDPDGGLDMVVRVPPVTRRVAALVVPTSIISTSPPLGGTLKMIG